MGARDLDVEIDAEPRRVRQGKMAARRVDRRVPRNQLAGPGRVEGVEMLRIAVARTAEEFYASLKAHGSTAPFRARMFDFTGLNGLIGTPEMLERGRRYAEGEPETGQASGRR